MGNDNGAPSKYLTALIKKKGLEDAERLKIISGAIPIGPPKRTYADNILIVGDAAAQTKPLSGGGLYTGMRAARWAAMTAVEALKSRDLSAKRLSEYEDRWRADIGKELDRGLLMRRAFVKMTDKKLDEVGRLLDRDDAKEVLATGDIDYPSKIASPLLRQVPSLIKFSPQLIGSLIREQMANSPVLFSRACFSPRSPAPGPNRSARCFSAGAWGARTGASGRTGTTRRSRSRRRRSAELIAELGLELVDGEVRDKTCYRPPYDCGGGIGLRPRTSEGPSSPATGRCWAMSWSFACRTSLFPTSERWPRRTPGS